MIAPLVMNVVTDACIMAIPAPVILRVKTTAWRKVALIIMFGSGLFIMTAAVLRVIFVLVVCAPPVSSTKDGHLPHTC